MYRFRPPHRRRRRTRSENWKDCPAGAFDRAYVDYMLSDHAADLAKTQKMAESASDPQVKELAFKVLPKLQDHLRLVENIAGQMGISPNKGLNSPK
jgi:predicted outer membrane protein